MVISRLKTSANRAHQEGKSLRKFSSGRIPLAGTHPPGLHRLCKIPARPRVPLGLQYSRTFWTSGSLIRPWARGLPCSRRFLFRLLSPGVQAGREERCADNMARPGEPGSPPAAWLPRRLQPERGPRPRPGCWTRQVTGPGRGHSSLQSTPLL